MGSLSDLIAKGKDAKPTPLSDLLKGEEKDVPKTLTEALREKGYLRDVFEDKGGLKTYGDSAARLKALTTKHDFITPRKDCDVLGDGRAGPSEDTTLLISRIKNISPGLATILKSAEKRGIIVCDLARGNVDYNGFNDPELGVIGINTKAPTAVRTATEEFVHAYQDHSRIDFKEYTLPDFNLWKMGIEAQAKLSVAVEAVRLKHSSPPNTELFDNHKRGPHFAIAKFLDKEVAARGLSALEDKEVLAKGFKMIMGHKDFSASYIARSIPGHGLDESVGLKQIESEDFIRHFGTIVGGDPRNNFLEGVITNKQDIINMLSAGSKTAINLQTRKIPSAPGVGSPDKDFTFD